MKKVDHQKFYRPDIDGLRAIAVLAVVMYHANFIPFLSKGGYTGVDIFFVISGFLITGILLRNLESKENPGKINIIDFYMRRIRRIFPALTVVLIAVIISSVLLLSPSEFKTIGYHVAAGSVYLSNFCLWHESGYFDFSSALKPLLHLWSLGIEEQFYIVWPLLLWIAYKLHFKLLFVTLTFSIVSFALCIFMIGYDPVQAFFSPWCRVWELSVGGSLAYILSKKSSNEALSSRRKEKIANVTSLLGITLLFSGFIGIRDDILFPNFITLIPVIGAALIIYSGSNAVINRTLLSSKLMVFMGLISYPLYLWHWPLLSFGNLMFPGKTPSYVRILLVFSAIILSWITYRFIEPPLRYGKYAKIKSTLLLFGLLCIGSIGLVLHVKADKIYSYLPWGGGQEFSQHEYINNVINQRLKLASQSTRKFIENQKFDYKMASEIFTLQNPWEDVDVAIIGDSHAQHLLPGLVYSSDKHKFALIHLPGELPLLGVVNPKSDASMGVKEQELVKQQLDIYQQAIKLTGTNKNIKTVILAHYPKYSQIRNVEDLMGSTKKNKIKILEEALKRTIEYFEKHGKKVIIISDNPSFPEKMDKKVNVCNPLRPYNLKGSDICTIPREEWNIKLKQYPFNQALSAVLNEVNSPSLLKVLDLTDNFCDEVKCELSNRDFLYYKDSNHLSILGSIKVSNNILKVVDNE